MTLEKEPFMPYRLEEERNNDNRVRFTVSLSKKEMEYLEHLQAVLEQPKPSTALKQLAWIGANVIREKKTRDLLGIVFKNKRNNARTGNPYD